MGEEKELPLKELIKEPIKSAKAETEVSRIRTIRML